jgi:hypothetical protein
MSVHTVVKSCEATLTDDAEISVPAYSTFNHPGSANVRPARSAARHTPVPPDAVMPDLYSACRQWISGNCTLP